MNSLLKKYYKKLAIQGILKSLIYSSILAFALLFITAILFWIISFKGLWISFVVFFVVLVLSTCMLYFVKFRPDEKAIAMKIDETGLEERVLTMIELKDDESYIARRQREDTEAKLKVFDSKMLKFIIPVPVIIFASVSFVFAALGSTTLGLYEAGIIKNGHEILPIPSPQLEKYEVKFTLEGNGVIEGELEQVVYFGEDTSPVLAYANEGWVFVGWSYEGSTLDEDPYHIQENVKESLTITAIFQEAEGYDSGYTPLELPDLAQGQASNPDQMQSSDGSLNDENNPDGDGNGNSGPGGGANNDANKQIIDNQTYYGNNVYDDGYDKAQDDMGEGSVSDDERQIGEDYWSSIKD